MIDFETRFQLKKLLGPIENRIGNIEGKQIWTIKSVRTINNLSPDDLGNINITSGISDAPSDGNLYGRKNAAWSQITGGAATWGMITGTITDQTDLLPYLGWTRDATHGFLTPTTSTDWVGLGQSTPLAPIHVGGRNVNSSIDSQVLVARLVSDTFANDKGVYSNTTAYVVGDKVSYSGAPYLCIANTTGNLPTDTTYWQFYNGHCFSDSSYVTRSGTIAYNSFDGRITVAGTNDYNHFAIFQNGSVYSTTGTITNVYGLVSVPTITAGTITNHYTVKANNITITGTGAVTNNYGYYSASQSGGTNNWGMYISQICAANQIPLEINHATGTGDIVQTLYSRGSTANGDKSLIKFKSSTFEGVQIGMEVDTGPLGEFIVHTNAGAGLAEAFRVKSNGNFLSQGIGYANQFYAEPTYLASLASSYGFQSSVTVGTGGALTNNYGVTIQNPTLTGTGAITNNYGVWIGNQTAGTSLNKGLYIAMDYTATNIPAEIYQTAAGTVTQLLLNRASGASAGDQQLINWKSSTLSEAAIGAEIASSTSADLVILTSTSSTLAEAARFKADKSLVLQGPLTTTNITDSGLTASKVVFTDASKVLTSTGIGTSSQFIKGDGSLDSSTYLTAAVTSVASGNGMNFSTITGTGTVTMGTPSSITSTSTNATSSTSHTHAVDSTILTAYPGAGMAVSTGSAWGTSKTTPTGDVVGTTDTQTLTNKRVTPRVTSAASYTTDTGTSINCDNQDMFIVTAQTGALKFNNPAGTPTDGQKLILTVASSTTSARALTWDTGYGATTVALPTTTAATTATLSIGFIYSSSKSLWQCVAVS